MNYLEQLLDLAIEKFGPTARLVLCPKSPRGQQLINRLTTHH